MVARRLKLLIKRQGSTEGANKEARDGSKETEAANKEAGMVVRRLKLLIKAGRQGDATNKEAGMEKVLIKRQEW